MNNLSLIDLAVLMVVAGVLIIAGIAVLNILRQLREKATPTVQMILDALLPYAQKAIVAGEKLAVEGLDDLDRKLDGADKAAIANSVYDTLTGVIYIAGRAVPVDFVKHFVTREMWADLVKRVYEETDAFVERNRDYFKKQIPTAVG